MTGADLFTTDDLAAHPGALAGRLVFTMGCHAGLQVPDVLLSSGDPLSKDWAEGYAQEGALLAANSGYGLGDTNTVAYSERLMTLFAKRLDGSLTIGQALAAAKADYYSSLGVIGVYDSKVLQEAVFYGLPFYSVGPSPVPAPARPAARADTLPMGTDPVTGLPATQVTLDPSFTTNTARDGSVFFSVGDEPPQVTHYRPLQPKAVVDVTEPASVGLAHGALVTKLTSSDQTRTITVDRPTVDEADAEPASAFGTVAFPSKLQTLATTTGPAGLQETLVLVPGQFLSGRLLSAGRGTQRLYSHVEATVLYSGSSDFDPPAIGTTSATVINRTRRSASASARRRTARPSSGCWCCSTTTTPTGPGRRRPRRRRLGLRDLDGDRPAERRGALRLRDRLLGAGGRHGRQRGRGRRQVDRVRRAVAADAGQRGRDLGRDPGAERLVRGPVTLPPDAPRRLDPVPDQRRRAAAVRPGGSPQLSTSGQYTVTAVADDGATGSGSFQVDLDAPTITPAAASLAFGQNSFTGTPFSCADAGSGIASCALTRPIAVNKPGKLSFTVQATDVAGNTASLTVPYIVDGAAPKVTLTVPGPSDGKRYTVGKNVIVRYTCHDPVQKKVSSGLAACEGSQPAGTKLDTSTRGCTASR